MLSALIKNETALVFKKPAEIFQPIIFGLITITLFVLAIGVDKTILSAVAAAVVWVIALLAILLSSDRLFYSDFEDGTLEQQQLAACSFITIIGVKLLVHWLFIVLPLIIICPIYAQLLFLQDQSVLTLVITLLLGTPSVVLFSALGSALTLSLKRGSLLLGLITTPLYVPVLIISISAIQAAQQQLNYSGQLALLLAMTLVSVLVCLPAITAALRLNN